MDIENTDNFEREDIVQREILEQQLCDENFYEDVSDEEESFEDNETYPFEKRLK